MLVMVTVVGGALGVATGDVVPGGVVWWGEPSDETVG